jgi:hypothetical protein
MGALVSDAYLDEGASSVIPFTLTNQYGEWHGIVQYKSVEP